MPASNKFKDQSIEELKIAHLDMSRDLFRMRSELKTTRKLEKPHRIKALKRDRARLLTALNALGGTLN